MYNEKWHFMDMCVLFSFNKVNQYTTKFSRLNKLTKVQYFMKDCLGTLLSILTLHIDQK